MSADQAANSIERWFYEALDPSEPDLFAPPIEPDEEPTHIAEGTLVAGRFRVGRLLGRGGHGSVYEAEHVVLGYPVAIKVLHAAYGRDPRRRARFRREALLGARLRHRNVVSIHDAGELADGSPFLVMEHVDGIDLSTVIERERLAPPATVEVGVQLLAAVKALFERGVIHRDIKPSNVMLQRAVDGYCEVKLLDFGISKALRAELSLKTLTADDCVLGTPQYMSPEQVRGEPLDVRSDLYAVGAVLYECLTGVPPFDAETPGAVLSKLLTTNAPKVRELRPDAPKALADLIDRAVEKRPEDRWSDPEEMSEALRALALRLGIPGGADAWRASPTARANVTEAAATAAFALVRVKTPTSAGAATSRRRRGWSAVAAALAAVVVLGGTTWIWSARGPSAGSRAVPPGSAGTQSTGPQIHRAQSARAEGTRAESARADALAGSAIRNRNAEASESATDTVSVAAEPPRDVHDASARASERPTLGPAQLERRARIAFLAGRDAEAVIGFARATEIAPSRPSAWRGLGLAAAAAGDRRTASRALAHYLALSPHATDRAAIERRLASLAGS